LHLRIKARATTLKVVFVFPHCLRCHAATFASRSGTPIEIVSEVILRPHLSTTQRYLVKVTDVEVMRWIQNLYG
jgi:site-specific recombinase XerD